MSTRVYFKQVERPLLVTSCYGIVRIEPSELLDIVLAQSQRRSQIHCRTIHRARRTHKVASIRGPSCQVLVDDDRLITQFEFARSEPRSRDRIADYETTTNRRGSQIVAKRRKRYVHTIRDKTDPETLRHAQHALNDVVVAVKLQGASITKMREH